jgi:hypothetical protein
MKQIPLTQDEFDWYITWNITKKTPYEVWVYEG